MALVNTKDLVFPAPVAVESAGEELMEVPVAPAEAAEAHLDPVQRLLWDGPRRNSMKTQRADGLVEVGSEVVPPSPPPALVGG